MVSSGQQQQANTLLVSSPVILSSTASHLTPTSNVISSIATQQANQQSSFLQFFQNQQQHRPPFLYSPQPFFPAQKANDSKQAMVNNPQQQTLLIGNVPSLQQQQFLFNKGKQIMVSQQTTNNLQPRSQLLPNLQNQSAIYNQQFLSTIPFNWASNNLMTHNQIFLRPQQLNNPSDRQLFLHTPANHQTLQTTTPIYLQPLVQSTASNNELEVKKERTIDLTNESKKELNNSSSKATIFKYRKPIGDKMLNNQLAKKKSRMIIQKSTQQMNQLTQQMNEQLNNNTYLKQKKDKLEKKCNVSIVKPCVVLTHNVSGYLIKESNKPFPVIDDLKNIKTCCTNTKKIRKHEKLSKTKSTDSSSSSDLNIPNNIPSNINNSNLIDNNLSTKPYLNKNIYRWSIDEVFEFVLETTSNLEFATKLKEDQFDGIALSFLSIPIMTKNFNCRLGPTLLLNKKIEEYKDKYKDEQPVDYLPPSGDNIFKWSVEDVYDFVLNLTSSKEIANEFAKQEIDGYSLTLISVENLRNDLKINYGIALKIICQIDKLKNRDDCS